MDTVMYFGTVWSWAPHTPSAKNHSEVQNLPRIWDVAPTKMWPFFSCFTGFTCLHCRQALHVTKTGRPFPVKIHNEYWVEFDTVRHPSSRWNWTFNRPGVFDDIGSAAYWGLCSTVSSANCMGFRPLWACKLQLRSWDFLQFAGFRPSLYRTWKLPNWRNRKTLEIIVYGFADTISRLYAALHLDLQVAVWRFCLCGLCRHLRITFSLIELIELGTPGDYWWPCDQSRMNRMKYIQDDSRDSTGNLNLNHWNSWRYFEHLRIRCRMF